MFGQFLIPQSTIVGHGHGPAVALGSANCGLLQLTLVIEKIVEQQSLDIHIDGSLDGETWGEKPLAFFPQKFYVGNSAILVVSPRTLKLRTFAPPGKPTAGAGETSLPTLACTSLRRPVRLLR